MINKIEFFTIRRSGSTILLKIFKDLFGQCFRRVEFDKMLYLGDPTIGSVAIYRDLRDVIVSTWRTDLSQNGITNISNLKMVKSDIDHYLNSYQLIKQVEDLDKLNSLRKTHKILFMKYEDFYDNFNFLFDHLINFFNITIPTEKRNNIKEKYSLDAIIKKTAKLDNFSQVVGFFHGQHVSPE